MPVRHQAESENLEIGRFTALEGHTVVRRNDLIRTPEKEPGAPLRPSGFESTNLCLDRKGPLDCGGKRSATPLWIG